MFIDKISTFGADLACAGEIINRLLLSESRKLVTGIVSNINYTWFDLRLCLLLFDTLR